MNDDAFERAAIRAEAEHLRQRDERRAAGVRTGFRIHFTVFLAVQLFLFVIWLVLWQFAGGTTFPWFLFALLGWGIGVAAHYAAVRGRMR